MLGFVFNILLPLLILMSPLANVSDSASMLNYGIVLFSLAWLFWGILSLFRSNKRKATKSGSSVLNDLPPKYSVISDYDILGIGKDATKQEIEAAYHAKMATFDPERIAKMGKSVQQEIKNKQERITNAYKTLMEQ